MTAFNHLDPGTPEAVWRDESRFLDIAELDGDIRELIVFAAHPDDETLGAAGLIRRVHEYGGRVTVVVATDGEASHPDSPTHAPSRLAALRRAEVRRVVQNLAPGAQLRFLGIPDGSLQENPDALAAAIADALESVSEAATVLAPWSGDGHRDHRILAEAVARACAPRGLRHLGYPIWLWHWGAPDDVPWERMRALVLSDGEIRVKRDAISVHVSQIAPLSPAAGDEPIVHAAMREHFERDVELFVDEADASPSASLPASFFTDFYRRNDDPWGFETRWYESRKRAVLMAALPSWALGTVLEIGCATGLITQQLLSRAAHVTALDPASAALEAAASRIGDDPRVQFVQAQVPQGFPSGRFETIVLSEVGYYLSRDDLARTVELIDAALDEGGCLIACHWRHPVAEYPLTGDDVHGVLGSNRRWQRLVRHDEEDFILEVFAPRPALSVARREGLS